MALPKRKQSKQRGRKRRTHYKIGARSLSKCPNCGAQKLPHRICRVCGYYRGKPVIVQKKKKEEKETKAK